MFYVNLCLLSAQNLFHRIDSTVSSRYYHMRGIDTTFISRPTTKWTITARMNVSGTKIKTEGMDNGRHFLSEMKADKKSTLSLGVSYLGVSLSASLNPAKLMGKYHDYELNFNSYGLSMVFNFTNIGNKESLTIHNAKWLIRTFFGLRLGK